MKVIKDIISFLLRDDFQWAFIFLIFFTLILWGGLIGEKTYGFIAVTVVGGDAYRRGK